MFDPAKGIRKIALVLNWKAGHMRTAAASIALLLAGCGTAATTSTRDLADTADANSRNALARVAQLESRVEALESELQRQRQLLEATGRSLDEARGNHTALLNTFNSNVDKSNDRDANQERDIDWLLRRNGVYR